MQNYFDVTLPADDLRAISSIGLAHLGDAVFELLVRTWLCAHGKATGRGLHQATIHLVCAESQAEKARWGRLMENYFQSAGLIDLGVLIVDARHKPTADDVTMREWFRGSGCPMVVVANKLDKLKRSEIEPNLALIRETLDLGPDDVLVPFSAEKGEGKDALITALAGHLKR